MSFSLSLFLAFACLILTPTHFSTSLRRRFQQNQEDCTYTVLALLPTAATKILETLDVEKITLEIQQLKGSNSGSLKSGKSDSMSLPETIGVTDEDGRSMVSASESGIHASQITVPPAASQAASEGSEQQAEKPKRTKRQLWGDVTISCMVPTSPPLHMISPRANRWSSSFFSAITRAFTLLYTLALLTMLTRVQLNLLGRRSYLSSVVSLATGPSPAAGIISLENKDDDTTTPPYGDDFEVNRKYLTFSWWLLNRGWAELLPRVEAAVRRVFGPLSPRDQVSFATFTEKAREVRRLVENDEGSATTTTTKWLPFLLPPPEMEDYVLKESGILNDSATSQTHPASSAATTTAREPSSPTSTTSLRRLLDETSDLIESPAFTHVLTELLDAGFSHLLDTHLASGPFDLPPPPTSPAASAQLVTDLSPDIDSLRTERKVLLPKCLSVLTRQAHLIGNGMPNEYLQAMEAVRDLEGFAAVVYSSNWENEIREEAMVPEEVSSSGASTSARATTTAASSVRQSAVINPGDVEESMVLVDPSQSSFESVWAKVTTTGERT